MFQKNSDEFLKQLNKYLTYNDLRYYALKYIKSDLNEVNQICFENLVQLFATMPGLIKQVEKTRIKLKPLEPEDQDNQNQTDSKATEENVENNNKNEKEESSAEIQNGQQELIKLFILSKETLTDDSKILQIDVHRKMYNDCIVKLLKYEVLKRHS